MPGPGDEIAAGAGGRAHMRASHADREQVIDMLKAAFVRGRLAKDEFDLRVGRVLASRTYADLGAVTADIPAGPVRAHSPNPARKPASMPMPTAVRGAVGLMCAGAVLTLADVGIVLVTLGGVRWAAAHDVGAGQWPFVMLTRVDFWLVSAPVGAGVAMAGLGERPGLSVGAGRFCGVLRPAHDCAVRRPQPGRLAVYLAGRARHGGALAGRAGNDGAYLQPDGQPVLSAPGSGAGSNTGGRKRTVA